MTLVLNTRYRNYPPNYSDKLKAAKRNAKEAATLSTHLPAEVQTHTVVDFFWASLKSICMFFCWCRDMRGFVFVPLCVCDEKREHVACVKMKKDN